MGGEGTFIYALHHPELFSAACPLSAATGTTSVEEFENYWLLQDVEGSQMLTWNLISTDTVC